MKIYQVIACPMVALAVMNFALSTPAEAAWFGKKGTTQKDDDAGFGELYSELNNITTSLLDELAKVQDEETAAAQVEIISQLVAKRKEQLKAIATNAVLHPIKAKKFAKENAATIGFQEGKLKAVTTSLKMKNYYDCEELGDVLRIVKKKAE